jgi:release factor glutamine methyltransferase
MVPRSAVAHRFDEAERVLVERLRAAGCVAAEEEAAMLTEAAAGDAARLESLVARREQGEPVEWIVGWAPFCGLRVEVHAGVYVPRAQTEVLARRAAELLTDDGVAVDLATGSGAVAKVVAAAHPAATVVAADVDPAAVACAAANGLDARQSDLDARLPVGLLGSVAVLTANVPYVPTDAIALLPRDVVAHEPRQALDGGSDGLDLVRRVFARAPRWLRPRGHVLVEIGPDQAAAAADAAAGAGLEVAELLEDEDGDVRALHAVGAP